MADRLPPSRVIRTQHQDTKARRKAWKSLVSPAPSRGWCLGGQLCCLLLALSACSAFPATPPATLSVYAAASLSEAFTQIGQSFESGRPGTRVTFNFAGSQQLAQQLAQGAPADVFASANLQQMDAVVEAGRVRAGAQVVFARNRLVVIFPKDNPAGLRTLADLARPGLRLVLAAQEVPAGRYALEFLERASQDSGFGSTFKDDTLRNVVSYEENVRAALSKVVLGEADAGIVYTSDVDRSAPVGQLDIPSALNPVASYWIAPITDSAHPRLAQDFIDSVLSPAGQAVLVQYGFMPDH